MADSKIRELQPVKQSQSAENLTAFIDEVNRLAHHLAVTGHSFDLFEIFNLLALYVGAIEKETGINKRGGE
jgi:hypothetical protein